MKFAYVSLKRKVELSFSDTIYTKIIFIYFFLVIDDIQNKCMNFACELNEFVCPSNNLNMFRMCTFDMIGNKFREIELKKI